MASFTSASFDDQPFLERLRQRDPAALAEAVAAHARSLLAGAMALGFPSDQAEDLVHDVFVVFLERVDRFEGRSQLRTWLFGILYNKAKERRRSILAEEANDPIDAVFEARFDEKGKWSRPPVDLERLILSNEIGDNIRACAEHLPTVQRQVFHLRDVEGFATNEICKILELSVTHFGVLLHRARTRLRECLEAKGVTKP